MGAFAGILMVYLIFNRPLEGYFLWPYLQDTGPLFWYFSQ